MVEKRKLGNSATKSETAKTRDTIVVTSKLGDNPDEAIARALTRPEINAAATIQRIQGDDHEVNALARELSAQVVAVNDGDLKRAEAMLIVQAHTLDEIFNKLARRAHGQEHMDNFDRFMRLALKAQSQCRATLETLAAVKNPQPVAFVRQANIAHGPQQVNNGTPLSGAPSRAREIENPPNKLLEAKHGERLDFGTQGAASGADPAMAAVGEFDGSANGTRQG